MVINKKQNIISIKNKYSANSYKYLSKFNWKLDKIIKV